MGETKGTAYLYLGVELETEAEDREELVAASERLHDKHSRHILQKEDGSLDCGVELVTGKFSLAIHQSIWPDICKTATAAGLRSWKHSSTGLHVHLSRNWFSQLDLAKFLCFINSEHKIIAGKIRVLAGRDYSRYAKFSVKKMSLKSLDSDSRYEAVNLTNDATIEVRIFKGTLKAAHVLADIEFCHALAWYCKEVSISQLENWDNFMGFVRLFPKQYRNLLEFFETH